MICDCLETSPAILADPDFRSAFVEGLARALPRVMGDDPPHWSVHAASAPKEAIRAWRGCATAIAARLFGETP